MYDLHMWVNTKLMFKDCALTCIIVCIPLHVTNEIPTLEYSIFRYFLIEKSLHLTPLFFGIYKVIFIFNFYVDLLTVSLRMGLGLSLSPCDSKF